MSTLFQVGAYMLVVIYIIATFSMLILFHRETSVMKRRLILADIILCAVCAITALLQGIGIGLTTDPWGVQYNWARYAEWAVTNPCMQTIISRMSGAPAENNIIVVLFVILMVACGAAGQATANTGDMWNCFIMGCLCMFVVFYELIKNLQRSNPTKAHFLSRIKVLTFCTLVSWILYPTVWALQFSRRVDIPNESFLLINFCVKATFTTIVVVDTVRHRAELLRTSFKRGNLAALNKSFNRSRVYAANNDPFMSAKENKWADISMAGLEAPAKTQQPPPTSHPHTMCPCGRVCAATAVEHQHPPPMRAVESSNLGPR